MCGWWVENNDTIYIEMWVLGGTLDSITKLAVPHTTLNLTKTTKYYMSWIFMIISKQSKLIYKHHESNMLILQDKLLF